MKNIFTEGDKKQLRFIVKPEDLAVFPTGIVHQVYSTFAIARDAEWTTRQFVIDMKENDEEGIGTMVSVIHHAPAFINEEITIAGVIKRIRNHEIVCEYEVRAGERLVASGETAQKILKRNKLQQLFDSTKQ